MNDIPYHLIEQIKAGNVVLFLGAGASFGATDDKGLKIPTGKELAKMLSGKFLGDGLEGDLGYISELSISESSIYEVQQYIAQIFKPFKPLDFHKKLPDFIWKAIFTTNYDLIVETVFSEKEKPFQSLVPVVKNTPRTQIFYKDNVLPYYKIHGCITDINDSDAPLILTPEQFANHSSKRDRLFIELQELISDYTFLFVGFGMADPDIRLVLSKLDKNNVNKTRSYMIGPFINDQEVRLWESKKITPLKMTFSNFISEVEKKIDLNLIKLASLKTQESLPIYNKFVLSTKDINPTEGFIQFITNSIEYLHSNINAPNTDPKDFYRGFFNNWDPIIKNLDVVRRIKDDILLEVFIDEDDHVSENTYLYLLKGNAGSGKSVLLKRLAYDAAVLFDRFCIVLKDNSKINYLHIAELFGYVKERIYLFVDNAASIETDLTYIIKRAKKEKIQLTVIISERINVWNTECQSLANHLSNSYHIKYLTDSEIRELLTLLERHNSLYTLKYKSTEERVKAFAEKAGRELLVALYEATNSKPFEEIIFDEYKSVNDARAQSLYLTVSIFHKIGSFARAGFISRVHNINFNSFKEELFKPLEFIVFDQWSYRISDYVYLTRNRMIAEIVFEKVLTATQDRYDEYIRILKNLNIDYDSDKIAFMAIVNARRLMDDFSDPQMIRRIYEIASELSESDPMLYQQQAIFEMSAAGGSMVTAEKHLKEAHELLPNDPFVSHTFAEMVLKKAEKAKINVEFYSYVDSVVEICNKIIKKGAVSPHPYHTILKAYLLKLKKVFETTDSPSIERILKDIEKVFSVAKQYFINDQFLLEIESKFNEIIDQDANAKKLLEEAFAANKSSPYIALRLINFYEKRGDLELAMSTINEALSNNAIDKDLNFKYATLLERAAEPNFDDIKYYLRRSFTKGDSRFQAQFWYARSLYLTNDLVEARDFFKTLGAVYFSPEIKNTVQGIIVKNGIPVKFEGIIYKIEMSFGFIKRDGFGDLVYFYRFDNDSFDWNHLKRNVRVSFSIGFNYKGSVAFNIELNNDFNS